MPRKQKKKKKKKRKEKRKRFQISYEKVWDTLTALNFINSAKSSVINKSL